MTGAAIGIACCAVGAFCLYRAMQYGSFEWAGGFMVCCGVLAIVLVRIN